ncbi:MAG TPA: hypothetical protein VG711_12875, partial [Phycisphaerales bacterium]|nr:hypothetical protein [Phycisphaerales bacterium]
MAKNERDMMLTSPDTEVGDSGVHRSGRQKSMLRTLLMAPVELFSSVRFGIVLLAILFIYSSIGSSGVPTRLNIFNPESWAEGGQVRQWRFFELTAFQWFNWWPFTTLILLICANIIITTIRKIPFTALRLGPWIIHTGIIILAAGSIWYFGTKVEGSSPVHRRSISIQAPGEQAASMIAEPGNLVQIGTGGREWR